MKLLNTYTYEIKKSKFISYYYQIDNENDVKLSVKVVYNKEMFNNFEKYDIYRSIWEKIKEINKTFPKYKHIVNLTITDQELIKTSTQKVKRQEEMKLILKEMEGEQKNV